MFANQSGGEIKKEEQAYVPKRQLCLPADLVAWFSATVPPAGNRGSRFSRSSSFRSLTRKRYTLTNDIFQLSPGGLGKGNLNRNR